MHLKWNQRMYETWKKKIQKVGNGKHVGRNNPKAYKWHMVLSPFENNLKKKRQTICLGSSFYNPVICYTSKTWREETLRKRSTWGMKETKLKQEERCVVTDVKEEDVRLCLVSNLLKSLIYKSCSVKYQCFTSRLTNILELTK